MAWRNVHFDKEGGSGDYTYLAYGDTAGDWWTIADKSIGTRVYTYAPTKDGYAFTGWWTGDGGTGTQAVPASGALPFDNSVITNNITLYAGWRWAKSVTLSAPSGTGAPSALYYRDGNVYIDEEFTTMLPATTITRGGATVVAYGPMTVPSKECYRFHGFYQNNSADSPGTEYITADGYVLQGLVDLMAQLTGSQTLTVYAKMPQVSKKFKLTPNNSTSAESGTTAIYCPYSGGTADRSTWYDNHLCEGNAINSIATPGYLIPSTKAGQVFNGYKASSKTYINANGTLGSELTNASSTVWQASAAWLATKKVTVDANGGTGGDETFYYCTSLSSWWRAFGGRLVSALTGSPAKNMITPPTREGYAFAGCRKSNDDTSALRVLPDGEISSDTSVATWPPTASNTNVYTRWTRVSYPVGFSGASETATPTLYAKVGGGLYRDADCTEQVQEGDAVFDELPRRTGYVFAGAFAEDSTASTRYTTAEGEATAAFAAISATDAGITVYLRFEKLVSLALEANGGTGGPSGLWLFGGTLYLDGDLTEAATWPLTELPRLECSRFDGYFEDDYGDGEYITSAGAKTSAFDDAVGDGLVVGGNQLETLYAHWTQVSSRVALDDNGGSGGSGAVYVAEGAVYSDDQATTPLDTVAVPVKAGYTFLGYFANNLCCIDGEGAFVGLPEGATEVHAAWSAKSYTLSFSGTATTKTVTTGSAIGPLPEAPAAPGESYVFDGWSLDGRTLLTAATVWAHDGDATASAVWRNNFGNVTDWFGMQGALLMLVGSESGEGRRVVNLWNGASEAGANLPNPVCTYRVKAAGNVTITLGAAWDAGYFITEFEYRTGADKEPLLVVRAAANEGANAINTYPVTFRVDPDHVAQDPFGAVSGGGELVELASGAKCDPVVPYEDNRPCASDVVHGRLTVSGRTAAYFWEGRPTLAAGFLDTGVPTSCSDVDFTTYSFTAEKAI